MTDQFARDKDFWLILGRAVTIGTLAGAATLAFVQIVRYGTEFIWGTDLDYSIMGGKWWWIAILTGTGLLVGLLRTSLKVPDDLEGSLTIVQNGSIDRDHALQAIGISVVSLIGGASLGPFDGGIRSGAMVGDWYASIRNVPQDQRESSVVSGINGSLGGLLTAPFLATLMVIEFRWPDRTQYFRALIPGFTAAVFGFMVNFAIVGDTFLGVFALPSYDIELWHFPLAVVLGFVAATLSWLLGLTVFVLRRWVVPLTNHIVLRSTVGGLALGLIAVAVPLTIFSGKSQLSTAIAEVETLGAALLILVVLAKIIAVGISLTSGFIGGPVMPTLFIGGTAGLAVHVMFPDIPIALAVSAMLIAVPGVSLGTPFTMIFLASLTIGIGAVDTVPAGIAVLTAYTLTAGLGWFGLPTERVVVDIDDVSVQSELFEVAEVGTEASDDPEPDQASETGPVS
ncbi:MAG: chloride channel protein [Acidimicrobiia bacterium]